MKEKPIGLTQNSQRAYKAILALPDNPFHFVKNTHLNTKTNTHTEIMLILEPGRDPSNKRTALGGNKYCFVVIKCDLKVLKVIVDSFTSCTCHYY